jgi:hypothetical protein
MKSIGARVALVRFRACRWGRFCLRNPLETQKLVSWVQCGVAHSLFGPWGLSRLPGSAGIFAGKDAGAPAIYKMISSLPVGYHRVFCANNFTVERWS